MPQQPSVQGGWYALVGGNEVRSSTDSRVAAGARVTATGVWRRREWAFVGFENNASLDVRGVRCHRTELLGGTGFRATLDALAKIC
jgi:hypothetical protein